MKRHAALLLAAVIVGCFTSMSEAVIVQWDSRRGGNGHFYEVVAVPGVVTWFEADAAARSAGGYLATITSLAENAFVFSLIDDPAYWYSSVNLRGPWIGGYQESGSVEPDGGWSWVTGEAFTYSNWAAGQPNEFNGNGEDYIHYGNRTYRTSEWNDVPGDFAEVRAYVVEYVPEPTTLLLLGLGAAMVRRRK